MVEVGVEDDEVRDGFRRNIQLGQLLQERVGNATDTPFHDRIGFPFDEIKVKKLSSQKGNFLGHSEWEKHKF